MLETPDVLGTTRYVVENARYVMIDQDKVEAVAARLAARELKPVAYDCDRHVCGTEPWVANFVLVLDTLNFSFWPGPNQLRWQVAYRGETVNGYWALVAALRRALDEGYPIADAAFLASLSAVSLGSILRGEGGSVIPLLPERAAALQAVGRGLLDAYGGQFVNLIQRAGGNAPRLTAALAREFASFDDVASYGDRRIQFFKRAQICCGDLHGASRGQSWGALSELDQLTAFADYKVPQVLRHLGILTYTDALARTIAERLLIPPGSQPEVEIRAATIWGVEFLRRALAARGISLSAYQLDWYVWELGQDLPEDAPPYHLTRTIYY
jgi:hypothetical protein